ncbi:MAG: hypothetical protein FJ405_03790 [Verrucomicrobia bacterium]|nr:hypothetical protein [Verrucomicrobiota bacterium]
MSLINDALKRANEQKARQASAAELSEELRPADESAETSTLWPIGIFAICLVGSAWFAWAWWHGGTSKVPIHADVVEAAARTPVQEAADYADQSLEPPVITPPEPAAETSEPAPEPEPVSPVASSPPAPARPSPVSAPVVPAPSPIRTASAPSQPATAAPLPARTPPIPVSWAPAVFPALTLQGIYFRPANPSVVINSRTLHQGDEIAGARILAIDRKEVTVQWRNEVRVIGFQ